jgi:hypothetical protein
VCERLWSVRPSCPGATIYFNLSVISQSLQNRKHRTPRTALLRRLEARWTTGQQARVSQPFVRCLPFRWTPAEKQPAAFSEADQRLGTTG